MDAVELITLDEVVGASAGLVYSTQPRRAEAPNGSDYFVKGPDQEIVFAELAGCLLASAVGIPVAPVAVCSFGGERFAGSCKVADIGRNVAPWLNSHHASNFDVLYATIVVDAWLANEDRNLGNVLGRSIGGGRVELVMIDYEKSVTLRRNPLVTAPTVPAAKLWPRGELGQILTRGRPLHPPTRPMQEIRRLTETPNGIRDIIAEVVAAIPGVDWGANSIQCLEWRATRIAQISGEVWDAA